MAWSTLLNVANSCLSENSTKLEPPLDFCTTCKARLASRPNYCAIKDVSGQWDNALKGWEIVMHWRGLEVGWMDSVVGPFTVDVADPDSRRSRGPNEPFFSNSREITCLRPRLNTMS
ncbi:uncharacterized protein LAJ45_09524 [Morchella importuna]|uniref:uncharacterized protein n=1 Tax=Morchella importuna TaxID=1174673 RepID=UPI001E8EA981|nr:uncharacterized protein LAJ45_09524 [Morchella importuna]KAH8146331.1 hypothetical protein LAJ45_09524 [Morchella importuna]